MSKQARDTRRTILNDLCCSVLDTAPFGFAFGHGLLGQRPTTATTDATVCFLFSVELLLSTLDVTRTPQSAVSPTLDDMAMGKEVFI